MDVLVYARLAAPLVGSGLGGYSAYKRATRYKKSAAAGGVVAGYLMGAAAGGLISWGYTYLRGRRPDDMSLGRQVVAHVALPPLLVAHWAL